MEEKLKMSIPVFHYGSDRDNQEFVAAEGTPYIKTTGENGVWAGDALYFWDNLSDAQYWGGHRHSSFKMSYLKCQLESEDKNSDMLDLTNSKSVREFEAALRWFADAQNWAEIPELGSNWEKAPKGKLINLYYNEMVDVLGVEPFKFVKIAGRYPRTPKTDILFQETEEDISTDPMKKHVPSATISYKVIYSVRNPSCLKDRRV